MATVRPFLWFNDQAAEAASLYAEIFDGLDSVSVGSDGGSPVLRLGELELVLFNGGPHFSFTPAISLFVSVDGQDEVDRLWDAFVESGGEPSRCGWITDRFGLSWQIVPDALGRLLGDPDPKRAAAAHAAMMTMSKLVVADLEAAADAA